MYADIVYLFGLYLKELNPLLSVDTYAKTVDKDHGQIEIRACWTLSAPFHQQAIRNAGDWEKLTSLVCVRRERRLSDKTQVEQRYYIASRSPHADQLLQAIRAHDRFEFFFTPKSASWLNMIEIEFSALSRLCLNRRIPTLERLEKEILALIAQRDAAHIQIHWQFSMQSARSKFNSQYVKVQPDNQRFKET